MVDAPRTVAGIAIDDALVFAGVVAAPVAVLLSALLLELRRTAALLWAVECARFPDASIERRQFLERFKRSLRAARGRFLSAAPFDAAVVWLGRRVAFVPFAELLNEVPAAAAQK